LDPGGFPLSTAVGFQQTPAVAFAGTNYLVVWDDYRSGALADIYGARVSREGQVLDPNGFAISTASIDRCLNLGLGCLGNPRSPTVAFDGIDYLVVWEDFRDFPDPFKIFGARVTPGGAVLDPNGFIISDPASGAFRPAIAFDGTNSLVIYHQVLNNIPGVYGVRVSPASAMLDPGGFLIFSTSNFASASKLAFDGTNYMVVWNNVVNGGNTISGTRVSPGATILDPGSIAISSSPAVPFDQPVIASAGGNFLVAWIDIRDANRFNLFGTIVASTGVVATPQGLQISLLPPLPAQISQGVGFGPAVGGSDTTFLATWLDLRNTDPSCNAPECVELDIYGQVVGLGVTPPSLRLICRPLDPVSGLFGQLVPLIARHCYFLATDSTGLQTTYGAYDIREQLTPKKNWDADLPNGEPKIPGGCTGSVLGSDCAEIPILHSQSFTGIIQGLEQAVLAGAEGRYDNVDNNSNAWAQRRIDALRLAVTLPRDVIATEGDLCLLLPDLYQNLRDAGVSILRPVILWFYGFVRCVL